MKSVILIASGLLLVLGSSLAVAAEATKTDQWDFYGGVGFAKEMESGAPGGSIAGQVGANYMVNESIEIGPMVGFYALGKTEVTVGNSTISTKGSVIPIVGVLTYNIPTAGTFKPYLTGGAGIYMFRSSTDNGTNSESGSESKFGGNFGVGFELAQGSTAYGLDARLHIAKTGSGTSGLYKTGDVRPQDVVPPGVDAGSSTAKVFSIVATAHFH